MARVLSVGLLAACTTTTPDEDALTETPDLGWATTIVEDPDAFSALMEGDRDGWVALHGHDYKAAISALDDGEVAALPLIEVYGDLQHASSIATEKLVTDWEARGSLGDPSAARAILLGARACALHAVTSRAALHARPAPSGTPREVEGVRDGERALARALTSATEGSWYRSGDELIDFGRVRVDPDRVDAGVASLVEVDADGAEVRRWSDPCLAWRSMTRLQTAHPDPVPDGTGLADTLFSARGIDVTRLGLPDGVPDTDDAQAARDEIHAMDAILDATRARLEKTADPDGLALLQQLRPLARLRQEVLVQRARRDLRAGHTQRAYATLLLARDVTERGIGASNGPALFALLAQANLRAGRSREALDALQPLVEAVPEAAATREIVSDLVVLEGIDRTGDSKEH